ncbi:MAG: SGNH/GDSL hydrolase family protein [Clostridia bacterium]|nr:SGNH/GDSL hydrolase family protein [Clostridia bacterium]
MKKVMLLGDSIRMLTQERVQEKLGAAFYVWAPEENCRDTSNTLLHIRNYLNACPNPDIIHWNNGLWDTAIVYDDDGNFTPIDRYRENLRRILRQLTGAGAVILFASTTPVRPEKAVRRSPLLSRHENADIMRYNAAAREVMRGAGIPVNDLWQVIAGREETLLRTDDMIHPTEEGIELLAEQIAETIRNCGGNRYEE